MNSASEGEGAAGVTYTAVGQGRITITNLEKQLDLTGLSAEQSIAGLNRDTAEANNAVQKLDAAAMQKEVEATGQSSKRRSTKPLNSPTRHIKRFSLSRR